MGWKQSLLGALKTVGIEAGKTALQTGVAEAQVSPYASILATILTTVASKNLPVEGVALATLQAFQVDLTEEELAVFVRVCEKLSQAKLSRQLGSSNLQPGSKPSETHQ